MKSPPKPPFRPAAEERLAQSKPVADASASPEKLLHELQVHQIELEMQNEFLRQAQLAMEESRDRYLDLYEFAPVGYLTLDATGTIQEANLRAATMLGIVRAELVGGRLERFVAAADRRRWRRHFDASMKSEARDTIEIAFEPGEGRVGFGRLDCIRVVSPEGALALRVAIIDISEERRYAKEMESYRSRLEDLVHQRTWEVALAKESAEVAERAKATLLGNVNHEIRTPLNSILGLTHLLRRGIQDANQVRMLERIESSGKQVLSTFSDIVDWALIESGKVVLEWGDVTLAEVVRDVVVITADKLAARGANLLTDVDEPTLAVRTDRARLGQALSIYVENAIKFSDGGDIILQCRRERDSDQGAILRFEVSDVGVGIKPDDLSRLFNPFSQVDPSMSRRYAGIGLGLAIARRLAILLGGNAGARSEFGFGSTFWLTIRPGEPDPTDVVAQKGGPTGSEVLLAERHSGAAVLVVEEDPANRDQLRSALQFVQINPDVAVEAITAIRLAERNDYDLILLDLDLPATQVAKLVSTIRGLPRHGRTPFVVLAPRPFIEDRERWLAAGVNDVVSKPCEAPALLAVVERWLSRPSADR